MIHPVSTRVISDDPFSYLGALCTHLDDTLNLCLAPRWIKGVKDSAVVHVHVQRLSGVWAPMRPDPHFSHMVILYNCVTNRLQPNTVAPTFT
jgi:hypothetical protein